MHCPTVKIKDVRQPSGFVIINESDFDPKVHALFDAATPVEAPPEDDADAAAAWAAEKAKADAEADEATERAAKEQAEADDAAKVAQQAKAKAARTAASKGGKR